jgi:hypothetical protein
MRYVKKFLVCLTIPKRNISFIVSNGSKIDFELTVSHTVLMESPNLTKGTDLKMIVT